MGTNVRPAAAQIRARPHRTREELLAEVERIGHELVERARAVPASPHPRLAILQLAAELHVAGHLESEVRALAAR